MHGEMKSYFEHVSHQVYLVQKLISMAIRRIKRVPLHAVQRTFICFKVHMMFCFLERSNLSQKLGLFVLSEMYIVIYFFMFC